MQRTTRSQIARKSAMHGIIHGAPETVAARNDETSASRGCLACSGSPSAERQRAASARPFCQRAVCGARRPPAAPPLWEREQCAACAHARTRVLTRERVYSCANACTHARTRVLTRVFGAPPSWGKGRLLRNRAR